MKLDPVYVVAPRPQVSTRRAFLLAGATGGLGLAAGFAGGYWAGSSRAAAPTPAPPIDARLVHALELAAPATPVATLLDNQMFLIGIVHEQEMAGRTHPSLWRAIHRIAEEVVDNRSLSDRRIRARTILDLLTRRRPGDPDFSALVPDLERAARR